MRKRGVITATRPRQKERKISSTELARVKIAELEQILETALKEARYVHILTMRASEEIGNEHNTGAAHACLALMEVSLYALSQANNAARYARHSLEYPRIAVLKRCDVVNGRKSGGARDAATANMKSGANK